MKKTSSYVLVGIIIVCASILAGCSEKITDSDKSPALSIHFSEKASVASLVSAIDTYQVIVTAPDLERIVAPLVYQDGYLLGQVIVPAGRARTFTVEARNKDGVVLFRGISTIDIPNFGRITLDIALEPVVPVIYATPRGQKGTLGGNFEVDIYLAHFPAVGEVHTQITLSEGPLDVTAVTRGAGVRTNAPEDILIAGGTIFYAVQAATAGSSPFVTSTGDIHLATISLSSDADWPINAVQSMISPRVTQLYDVNGAQLTPGSIYADQSSISLMGDRWQAAYGGAGGEVGFDVIATADGGFVIAGVTNSFGAGGTDVYLMKVNAFGSVLWEKTYGTSANDWGNAAAATNDGGFVIAGYTTGDLQVGTNGDAYLVKTDAAGNMVWEGRYGGDLAARANDVLATPDGGYMLIGSIYSPINGNWDMYAVKTDASGVMQWENNFGGNNDEGGNDVKRLPSGGYFLSGWTESYGAGSSDMYLVRIDDSGTMLWDTTFGGEGNDGANAAVLTADGNLLLSGWTTSYGNGFEDIYLLLADTAGAFIGQRTYGGANLDDGVAVIPDGSGGFIVAGLTYSLGAGSADVYVLRLDNAANVLWQKTYGGTGHEGAMTVAATLDGNYIVSGWTGDDIYVIKIDGSGNVAPLGLAEGPIVIRPSIPIVHSPQLRDGLGRNIK